MGDQGDLFPSGRAAANTLPVTLTSEMLVFRVHGTPAPQGSKKGFYNKGTGRVQMVESSKNVKPWREAVKYAALEARQPARGGHVTLDGPVKAELRFSLPRPKGHFGTGRNAGLVKESAPAYPTVKPDIDKLVRSTLDALKDAQVFKDDSQIVMVTATKNYPVGAEGPGVLITVGRV